MSVDSILWLDPAFLVDERLAGASFDVTIADRKTILTLPSGGPDTWQHSPREREPEWTAPTFPAPPLSEPPPPKG